jgi:hypothetical protein
VVCDGVCFGLGSVVGVVWCAVCGFVRVCCWGCVVCVGVCFGLGSVVGVVWCVLECVLG